MGNAVNQLLEFGPFRVDPDQRLLLRDQQTIPLSPKAFDLLLVLAQRSGQVVLKDDLMKLLWPNTFVEESNLGQHVFQLRKALGERPQDHAYIVTIPGRGYRFAPHVRTLPAETEEIVVQTHSRSRLVIEETVAAHDHGLELVPGRDLKALPTAESATRRRLTFGLFGVAGVVIGALAVWAFFRPLPLPHVMRTLQLTHIGRVEPFSRTLTDGARIYFAERMGGTWSLAQVSERGGDPTLLPSPLDRVALYDIDQRRSKLLVAAQSPLDSSLDPLWVMPTTGGSPRRVGNFVAGDAAWAPDGHSLAFCRDGDLYVAGDSAKDMAKDDSQPPRKLFSLKGRILFPRWSPDGKRINFTRRDVDTGVLSLWEIGQDGSSPHALQLGWKSPAHRWDEGECCGDWSPDGRYFIFRSIREDVHSFWLIREGNGWLHRSASPPVQLYMSPDWISDPRFNADGNKIFFVDHKGQRELVRYDTVRKLFVPYLGGIQARHLSFSRDGQWVSYKSEVDGTLWRSRVDGTQAMQLTFPPLDVLHSTWSPDGQRIVFAASGNLYMISRDGGNPERLTSGGQPSWSPDGKSILLARFSLREDGSWRPALYEFDLNTRETRIVPGGDDFEGPQWSPDGRYVAASDKKDQKLMLFDPARRQWSELADGVPYGWGIRWSSDAKYVYYQHVYSGEEQPIFRVRVSDHKVEQVTSSRQILRADVLSYTMTGLTPDNAPLASLVHSNSDIFALELDLP
jgi:DNA-binding winged helix-turn-helix (wHTH) protein/Tol biopolymer transport system component